MTVPSGDARAAQRASLRRAVLQLVLGVVVLDAVALGAFYLTGIAHGPSRPRTIFVAAWTIATAITVAVLLRRVRRIRFGGRPR